MGVEAADARDFDEIEAVWWASVQATHHFIDEAYLKEIKSKLKVDYLPQVQLYVWRDGIRNEGFLGLGRDEPKSIEMLFVRPQSSGRGIGGQLLTFALRQGCHRVDVNEANEEALRFYKKHGFVVTGRSEVDATEKAYPTLHLQYQR
jgi:GNAT superfamily N-acetyltransferase